MKRKIIMVATILFLCLLFGGCEKGCGEDIKIYDGGGCTASYIEMDTKYKLMGYDKEYAENGCIVHIYYEIKG